MIVAAPSTFGRELDELRRRAGLSVRELARSSGLSRGYIGDLLTGHRGHTPSDDVVERLARAVGVPSDYFADYRRRRAFERFPEEVDELYWRRRA